MSRCACQWIKKTESSLARKAAARQRRGERGLLLLRRLSRGRGLGLITGRRLVRRGDALARGNPLLRRRRRRRRRGVLLGRRLAVRRSRRPVRRSRGCCRSRFAPALRFGLLRFRLVSRRRRCRGGGGRSLRVLLVLLLLLLDVALVEVL